MSVWPPPPTPALSGSEGALVSISIDVDPRYLESLLEALARVSFPINPQIYHEAALVYRYADGHRETEAVTLVEFPAYAGQLEEVRAQIASEETDLNELVYHMYGLTNDDQRVIEDFLIRYSSGSVTRQDAEDEPDEQANVANG